MEEKKEKTVYETNLEELREETKEGDVYKETYKEMYDFIKNMSDLAKKIDLLEKMKVNIAHELSVKSINEGKIKVLYNYFDNYFDGPGKNN